ncbi:hypothetical protein NEICINOT_04951 [Neisseria cinerea ATCC 14685]|uniref:Uncharacterized protein n=1 Tax=Neisseria cinerea ATCC 14685 TaxID=546262 RepID=D0W5I5_NEICI|nr:hypothetical protein NEICINOT_04951 [Neisseria cinerea ATCC 14685]
MKRLGSIIILYPTSVRTFRRHIIRRNFITSRIVCRFAKPRSKK